MATEKFPLSIIVHTKNSERTLKQCLNSAKFADDLIVVDMNSSDKTKQIASEFTKKIVQFEDVGYVEPARNFGIKQATHDWILLLDADEELSDGLKIWLESFVTGLSKQEAVAFYIPRRNFIFDQEIRHTGWWPDYQLRLFKKGSVSWPSEIHSVPKVQGETVHLSTDPEKSIVHHNYHSVEQFVERMNRYSSIMAEEKTKNGKQSISALSLSQTFTGELSRRLFEWEGVKDGGLGMSLAILQSTSELLVQLKQWEKEKFKEKDSSEEKTVAAIEDMDKVLKYWIADWYVKHETGLAKIIWAIRRKLSW